SIKLYLPRLVTAAASEDRSEIKLTDDIGAEGTILLVEDEEDVRVFTAEVLRELGYQVTAASNGASALTALDRMTQLDLLFTDVGLPDGMNGRQLADAVTRRRTGMRGL